MILRASHTLVDSGSGPCGWVLGGGVQIAGGKIERIFNSARSLARAASANGERPRDLGDGLLLPGFVNAHAHLELSDLRLPSGPFAAWIGNILQARSSLVGADYSAAVLAGEERLLRGGTTCVGDIASSQAAGLCGRRLRSVVYREILDAWNPERSAQAMGSVRRALPKRRLRQEGLSPHAPYTVSAGLLAAAAKLLRRRSMPLSMHWAESEAEMEWMAHGSGPFAPFFPASPRTNALDLLERAGLLKSGISLVHGNHPARGEPERLAQARVVLVHCPGTHRFFGRDAFPWRLYRRAGVEVALGTDSSASNDELDMRREMALARAGNAQLSPLTTLGMATHVAAKALGMGALVGAIAPGRRADLAFHVGLPRDPEEALDALTMGQGEVARTFVAGRRLR